MRIDLVNAPWTHHDLPSVDVPSTEPGDESGILFFGRANARSIEAEQASSGLFLNNAKPKGRAGLDYIPPMAKPRTRAGVWLSILLGSSVCAFALDPSLDVSQYAHSAWRISEGFTKGTIFSIAQTPDGYLWLGTEFGLLRFDGVQAAPWQAPDGEQLPSNWIQALLVARDGTLWIGTDKGLASWKHGKLTKYPEVPGQRIDTLVEDREGTVWAGVEVTPGLEPVLNSRWKSPVLWRKRQLRPRSRHLI